MSKDSVNMGSIIEIKFAAMRSSEKGNNRCVPYPVKASKTPLNRYPKKAKR